MVPVVDIYLRMEGFTALTMLPHINMKRVRRFIHFFNVL